MQKIFVDDIEDFNACFVYLVFLALEIFDNQDWYIVKKNLINLGFNVLFISIDRTKRTYETPY